MYADKNRVMGCLMGGAVGDAFGAPVEGIRDLKVLKGTYGENGLQNFVPYKSFWDDAEPEGLGIITDDTTMAACTLAGIIDAPKDKDFQGNSLHTMWQHYIKWGSYQQCGEEIGEFLAVDYKTPDYLRPFLFRCGAGKNTIAALSTGYRGDLNNPVIYDRTYGDKHVKGPNNGCGGQMRIAPVAFLYSDVDLITYSMRAAAITHGHYDAMAATSATACLVANALKCDTLKEALQETKKDIMRIPKNDGIIGSWNLAEHAIKTRKVDIVTMDGLGLKQGKNPFLSLPVFTQTLYAVQFASKIGMPKSEDFKDVMRLSANHTGDSDSVAAIVGNVLGASWGYQNLPTDWIDVVQQKDDILVLASTYIKSARGVSLKP